MPARQPLAAVDEDPVLHHPRPWRNAGQFRDRAMMRRAVVPVQQPRPARQQRTRADRGDTDAGPHRAPQPANDGVIGGSDLVRVRPRSAMQRVRRTGNHDQRVRRQRIGQRRDAGYGQPDRAVACRAGSDIGGGKAHRRLFEIGLAKDLHRTGNVEQQHARRHHDDDRNDPRALRRVAHAASFSGNRANASSTVTIRAKRPASTSSVRSRISAGLHSRPAASVIAKVSVASPT